MNPKLEQLEEPPAKTACPCCDDASCRTTCNVRKTLSEIPWEAFALPVSPSPEGHSAPLQGMPPPHAVETLVTALEIGPEASVLHIGAGTGYTSAVLGRLANRVYAIERQIALVEFAKHRFKELGYENIDLREGNGLPGWPEAAPFDAILISATAFRDPPRLLAQLRVGGRLVMLSGRDKEHLSVIRFTRKGKAEFIREALSEVRLICLIGDILVEIGAAEREDVERAALQAQASGRRLGDELGALKRINEADLYRALAMQRGLRFEQANSLLDNADPSLCQQVPRGFLEHNNLIPICRTKTRRVKVATCDPQASPEILTTALPGCRGVDLCLVTPTDYRRLWLALDLRRQQKDLAEERPVQVKAAPDLLGRTNIEAHHLGLFNALLLEAIAERASDIHLERYGNRVRVRMRVDGRLRDLPRYNVSPTELLGLINVIKIKAQLDIAERRLPQGGRIHSRSGGQSFDLRVQTQPSLHGEHAVIRLLPQDTQLLTIEDLGFPTSIADEYRRLLASPAGLILVVGPTGSGKSTTLYSGLQVLARDSSRKVLTAEDPIEYSLEDVQQSQVRPIIGFNFAQAMRAFVREDPDVILIGEIRDRETALEAIRASQTGHVVLSTLHCNDAVDAVQRLTDLGMHPNSISSELLAVIAQRLVRRLCRGCRSQVPPDPKILGELFPAGPPDQFRCYESSGCVRCRNQGTYGRIASLEYLRLGPAVRSAITRRTSVDELRKVALEAGLVTMRDSAIDLVTSGITPLSELPRILPLERMAPER